MKKSGYLKNTNVVILGDHLFMASSRKQKSLHFANERYIFNRFFTEDKLVKNRDEMLSFDMFPTILYSLGFSFERGQLGLGYSGYGEFNRVAKIMGACPRDG